MSAARPGGSDPDPMTDQDLDDWCAEIDARAAEARALGIFRPAVIAAGQAAADVTKARWRRS